MRRIDFNWGEYIVPLAFAKKSNSIIHLERFAVTGFFIDQSGLLITCKHIFEERMEGELIIAKDLSSNEFYEIKPANIKSHPSKDFSLVKINFKNIKCFKILNRKILPGEDIISFGFTLDNKTDDKPVIEPRILKGHIVRFSE